MKNYQPALRTSGLFLASLALLPFSAAAQAQSPAANALPKNAVSRVEVVGDGNAATVRVESSADGDSLNYHVSRLPDPPRVVLELSDARLTAGRNAIPSTLDPIRGVRVAQYRPDEVRVVVDLVRPSEFAVAKNGHELTVTFINSDRAHADITANSNAVPSVASPAAVKLASNQKRTGSVSGSDVLPLPALLTRSDAAMASPAQGVGPGVSSGQVAQNGQAAQATQVSVQTPAQTSAPAAQAGSGAEPNYSGEPISVNLKDVDLKDFFRLIHEISGLNVVLDPSVHGTVTLVLDEVPWDQALEIVLKNNALDKELDGNVLRIVTNDTLRKEADSRRDLIKAQSDSVQPETVTRVLNYAKATEMVAPLKRFVSARGDVMAIDRSNTLIVRDIPENIPGLDNLIRQLDRKTPQVQIEARVVQATRSFARDIGTQFGISAGWAGANSANAIGGDPIAAQTSPLTHPVAPPLVASGTTSSIPLLSNFPANAPTSGLIFSHSSPNFALDYIITAAESKGVGKLLSAPQLVTQNNAQAVVKQGAQIPIQTTVNNTISTTYIDAVLKLEVTPQITSEGTVFLDVTVENTQADFSQEVQGDPTLDTQSAQTKVLIEDGGTVVIGGVMETSQNTTIQQVPLLGSIPVIGHLFSRDAVSVSTQELLFFLTPRILPG
jgi:type IV pilus secretin PilQ/predicted competence protein